MASTTIFACEEFAAQALCSSNFAATSELLDVHLQIWPFKARVKTSAISLLAACASGT